MTHEASDAIEQTDRNDIAFGYHADETPRHKRGALAWIKTLAICGTLVAGLFVILPMMPDRDPRGSMQGSSNTVKATNITATTTINGNAEQGHLPSYGTRHYHHT